jgi:curved DNA-binding protein CbpA
LLELDRNILDKDFKKAYQKIVLCIHPDKLKLQSGEEAFKVLNAAYKQAEL